MKKPRNIIKEAFKTVFPTVWEAWLVAGMLAAIGWISYLLTVIYAPN